MKKFIGNKDFYKLVAALALPLLLQNAVSTFVNLLDNLMVGRIGTESMSGVSIVNQLLFVYNLCLFGGTGGAGIFGAQFFGRGDYNGVRHTLRFNILLCAGFTVIATVLLALIPDTLIGAFLHEEEKVQLMGFGSFEVKKRAARTGRNPRSKETIEIPASQTPVFKAGKALKDAVAK